MACQSEIANTSFTEAQNGFGLKRPLEVQPPVQQGPCTTDCFKPCLWRSMESLSLESLWATCAYAQSTAKWFLVFRWNLLFSSFCSLPLVVLLEVTEESGCILFAPSLHLFIDIDKICWILLSGLSNPSSFSFPHRRGASLSAWLFTGLSQVCPSRLTEKPSTPDVTSPMLHWGEGSPSLSRW